MHTLEKPKTLPSLEQLGIALGKNILILQEEYRAQTGKVFDEVARHKYVEGLCALSDDFGQRIQMKTEEKGIEDVASFVVKVMWGKDIEQKLLSLNDEDLDRVIIEAERQRGDWYERYKKQMSVLRKFMHLFRGGFQYGDMFEYGTWGEEIFRRLYNVETKGQQVVRMRELLHAPE